MRQINILLMKIMMMMLMKSILDDFDKVVLQFFFLFNSWTNHYTTNSISMQMAWVAWLAWCHGKTLVNDFFNYYCKIYNIYYKNYKNERNFFIQWNLPMPTMPTLSVKSNYNENVQYIIYITLLKQIKIYFEFITCNINPNF